MDAKKIIETAVSTGECPFIILRESQRNWGCDGFKNCGECADALIDLCVKEATNGKN